MDASSIEASLRAFLRDQLRVRDLPEDSDAELVSSGLIDSVDLVRVATHLERELGIAIPDSEIEFERFDSIAKITALALSKLGG